MREMNNDDWQMLYQVELKMAASGNFSALQAIHGYIRDGYIPNKQEDAFAMAKHASVIKPEGQGPITRLETIKELPDLPQYLAERVYKYNYKKYTQSLNPDANAELILSLAYCFEHGIGTDKDDYISDSLYMAAAKKNNADAQLRFGLKLVTKTINKQIYKSIYGDFINDDNQRIYRGIRWIEKAAKQGNKTAIHDLYYYAVSPGNGYHLISEEICKEVANLGYQPAMVQYAWYIENDKPEEAKEWRQKAAERKYALTADKFVKDTVDDYSRSILVPRLVKELVKFEQNADKFELSNKVMASLNTITRNTLFKDLAVDLIQLFSAHWHTPLQQMHTLKEKDHGGISWEPLFATKYLEIPTKIMGNEPGWKLIARTTPAELKKEGRDLKHCVGGYSGKCITEDCHIVSVVNPAGAATSTIDFRVDYQKKEYKINQHYGANNNKPDQKSLAALKWFEYHVNSDNIIIDYDGLKEARDLRTQKATTIRDKATLSIGFDPLDSKKVKTIIGVYKKVIPHGNENITPQAGEEKEEKQPVIKIFEDDVLEILHKNFKKLKTLPVIDLGTAQLCGHSKFYLGQEQEIKEQEVKGELAKPKRSTFTYDVLSQQLQRNMDALLGADNVKISKLSQKSKYVKMRAVKPGFIDEIMDKLINHPRIKSNNKVTVTADGDEVTIAGLPPLPLMDLLKILDKKQAGFAADVTKKKHQEREVK